MRCCCPASAGIAAEVLSQNPRQVTAQGEPRRHQVTELPPIRPHITEYQFPNVVCGHCGKTTHEPLPEEIAGYFGPQLAALIAYLTVSCRMPRRVVEALHWNAEVREFRKAVGHEFGMNLAAYQYMLDQRPCVTHRLAELKSLLAGSSDLSKSARAIVKYRVR